MTKEMQPEALRLAHMLELLSMDGSMGHEIAIGRQWCSDAAAELRRLHARVQELERDHADEDASISAGRLQASIAGRVA